MKTDLKSSDAGGQPALDRQALLQPLREMIGQQHAGSAALMKAEARRIWPQLRSLHQQKKAETEAWAQAILEPLFRVIHPEGHGEQALTNKKWRKAEKIREVISSCTPMESLALILAGIDRVFHSLDNTRHDAVTAEMKRLIQLSEELIHFRCD